jgi:ATP-dependent RNA helicase RhlE
MTRVKKKGTHKGSIFSGKPAKSTGRTGSSSNRAGRRARRAEKSRDIEDVVMATVGDKLKRKSNPQKADRPKKREVRNEQNAQNGSSERSNRKTTSSRRTENKPSLGQQGNNRRRAEAKGGKRNHTNRSKAPNQDRRKGRRVSQLTDFSLLVKKAKSVEEVKYQASRTFDEMPLQPLMHQNLKEKGYEMPSQIQDETLENLQNGHDLIGVASTGTGKTAAFLIPIVDRLMVDPVEMTALVVVPTRELALQVEQEFRSLTKGTKLYSSSFIGGTKVDADFKKARRRNHIIIGTPGRLKDMIDRRALRFNKTSVLVLDEFDRMLDMGFVHDIREIVSDMPERTQTMLFSATVEKGQEGIIAELMKDPITVQVSSGKTSTDNVEQDIIQVPEDSNKLDVLTSLIEAEENRKILVFTETKRWADKVTAELNKAGIRSDMIHGDKKQNYRLTALRKFKRGDIQVLVATDVAARGIDVNDVSLVVNYELPLTYDSYIHRIGRTGRAGKSGKAYTFVN